MSSWTPEAVYKLISSIATLALALWLISRGQSTQDVLVVIAMINQIVVANGASVVTSAVSKVLPKGDSTQ